MGYFSDITNSPLPTQTQQPQAKGGFKLADLLPIAGGTLGGIGGSLIGPLGTIGGGAAGSALGQWLENLVTGAPQGEGVATQGALGALGGVGGELLGGAGKLLGIGGKVATTAAADAAGETAAQGGENIATRAGSKLLRSVLGTGKGVGASPLGAATEQELVSRAQQLGVKSYTDLPKVYTALNEQVGQQLAPSKATIPFKTLWGNIEQNLKDGFITIDEKSLANEQAKLQSLADAKGNISVQDLFNYKDALNGRLGNAFKALDKGTLSSPQETGLGIWNATHGAIGEMEPAVNALTGAQSDLYKLAPGLKSVEGKGGIGIKGLTIPGSAEVSTAIERGLGNSLSRGGARTALGTRAGSLALTNAALGSGASAVTPSQDGAVNALLNPNGATTDTANTDTSSDSSSGPTLDNQTLAKLMILDLSKTGGKNMALLQTLGKLLAPGAGEQTLSTAAQARHDSLQTALASLDGAEQNLVTAGGARGPLGGFLATKPVIGGLLDPKGAAYTNTKIEIATQLAKAITGGSRPAQSVIDKYVSSLPDVTDTPAYAAAKLQKLRNEMLVQAKTFKYNDILNLYK